eukprot:7383866-Prymnesium_polylepis.1
MHDAAEISFCECFELLHRTTRATDPLRSWRPTEAPRPPSAPRTALRQGLTIMVTRETPPS